jgi:hypothetical protein
MLDNFVILCYYCYSFRRYKIKTNYLNNKDILKEIHKSKTTYCCYTSPEYADYDMILPDFGSINAATILEARGLRAERLAKVAHEAASQLAAKCKLADFEVPIEDIKDTDVVFRVMTWEHIPLDDIKTRKARMAALDIEDENDPLLEGFDENDKEHNKYVKVNFPPFKHYKLDESGTPVCVGKSHWVGTLDDGEFSKDHGKMTKTLANMYIKLCERYGTRSNWRGYTYNDEMRAQALLQLTYIGLRFDESKSANPFAYYTAAVTNSFTRVLNIEKRNQNIRDDILEMNGLNPSYTRQGMGGGYVSSGEYEE